MAGGNIDPLVVGRVIGDVVDLFVPTVSMSVYYGSKHVNNGCDIKPSMAATPPRVTITGNLHQLYTLVMTDPDALSPSEPTLREWVHWIVADIPGCSNVTRGRATTSLYFSNRKQDWMSWTDPIQAHICIEARSGHARFHRIFQRS